MRLPHFEYIAPRTLDEACSFLAEHPREALPIAGGTDLLVKMKQRRIVPRYLVNLKTIPAMDYITYDGRRWLAHRRSGYHPVVGKFYHRKTPL